MVLLRDLAVMAMCALVVWQIYRPERDLVRSGGSIDDPSGGIFDNAVDSPPAWLPSWLRPRPAAQREPDEGWLDEDELDEDELEEMADEGGDRALPAQHVP
jgi:uncharacterized membrane protein